MVETPEIDENTHASLGTQAAMQRFSEERGIPANFKAALEQAVHDAPHLAQMTQADQIALLNKIDEQIQNFLAQDMDLETSAGAAVQGLLQTDTGTGALEASFIELNLIALDQNTQQNAQGTAEIDTLVMDPYRDAAYAERVRELASSFSGPVSLEDIRLVAEAEGLYLEDFEAVMLERQELGVIEIIKPEQPQVATAPVQNAPNPYDENITPTRTTTPGLSF